MPWLETAPMEQRERFIRDWQSGLYTMTELSTRYDVSRKTSYKWLDRFDHHSILQITVAQPAHGWLIITLLGSRESAGLITRIAQTLRWTE